MKFGINGKIVEIEDVVTVVYKGEIIHKLIPLARKEKLRNINIGDVFKIDNTEYILLEKMIGGIACIAKYCFYRKFDPTYTDWTFSSIREYLNGEYLKKLEHEIGLSNIISHVVDLTSDDGLKDYGITNDKVSLLTCDMYREYVFILNKYKTNRCWWLSTSKSTETHMESHMVCCVGSYGTIEREDCSNDSLGVRPFFILNNNVEVIINI